MAIFHTSVKAFSRGKNHSSVAAAAYRAGVDLVDTSARVIHRYSHRKGVISHHMLAPAGAPDWCSDPKVFWDANEAWESRANARLAREVETSLPSELNDDQRTALAIALGQALVDRYGVVVLVAIHGPGKHSDDRNFHTHLLMSARQLGPDGFGERACSEFDARGGRGAEAIREVRGIVADVINAHIQRAGIDQRVDHRRLTVQAAEAAAQGDYPKAIELTRPPKRRLDRATFLAMKAEQAQSSSGRAEVAPAVEHAQREGRLFEALPGQYLAALRDICREHPPKKPVSGKRASTASTQPNLQTSKVGRAVGAGAEVLNAEARVIEDWLASQLEAARIALDSVRDLPGFRIEDPIYDAMLALECRRDGAGYLPGFRDAVDSVVQSMQIYAGAMLKPQRDRETVARALAQITVAEDEVNILGKSARHLRRARENYNRAKEALMGSALGRDMDVINQARVKLFMDVDKLNRLYPLVLVQANTGQDHAKTPATTAEETSSADVLSKANRNPRFKL